jgi:Tfp pilus assembly protein PilZ
MKEGRVCVTHDDDFLRIHATGAEYSGIAYVHQKRLTIGETVLALVTLQRDQQAESVAGQVVFLQPGGSRDAE